MADICEQIRHVIFSIKSEAATRGLMDKFSPARVLGAAEDRQAVSDLFDNRYDIRGQRFDDQGKIRYDTAEAELNQPSHMNTGLLLFAVKRFQDLPEEEKAAWQN